MSLYTVTPRFLHYKTVPYCACNFSKCASTSHYTLFPFNLKEPYQFPKKISVNNKILLVIIMATLFLGGSFSQKIKTAEKKSITILSAWYHF